MKQRLQISELFIIVSFLALPILLYTVVEIFSIGGAFTISFTRWTGGKFEWAGISNYLRIFSHPMARTAALNTISFTLITVSTTILFSFGIALGINSPAVTNKNIFILIFVLPQSVAAATAGLIWSSIYAPELGLLNIILRRVGLDSLAIPWLGDPKVALFALAFAQMWIKMGFYLLMFYNRLRALPKDLMEAAQIDGASALYSLRKIIIPLCRSVFSLVVVLTIIDALRTFDIIFATTRGGPAASTEVLGTLIFREAFTKLNFGYASSLSAVLFAITMIITFFYLTQAMRKEEELA